MSYQFAHIETFARTARAEKTVSKAGGKTRTQARKSSASDAAAEAMRIESHSEHVENPQPPKIVFGEDPRLVVAKIEELADTLKDKSGRKLRSDAQVLAVIVSSHPTLSSDLSDSEKRKSVDDWIEDTTDFAKQKYGHQLKSVVLHEDESHPHVHIFLQPDNLKIENVHDGIAAKKAARASKQPESSAYRKAMQTFQDDLYEKVSSKHGMTRLGPKVQRLTRKQYMAKKADALAIGKAIKGIKSKAKAFNTMLVKAKSSIKTQRSELHTERVSFNDDKSKHLAAEIKKALDAAAHALTKEERLKRTARHTKHLKEQLHKP